MKMKKIMIMVFAVMCYFVSSENISYAKSSGEERVDRLEDIIDIFDEDDDKDKKDRGNSEKGRDNHGQNKKK